MAYEYAPLQIAPGIFKESSETAAIGRYIDGNNIRFWKGYPERIGGWSSVSDSTLTKPPRGAHAWQSLANNQFVAFGHARGVQLFRSGVLTDISPTGANGFSTLTITLSGISGPYTAGETVTAAGGGTAIVVSFSSPAVFVSADSGTFTGTLTGGSSGSTGTITATADTWAVDGGSTFSWGESTWGISVWGGTDTIYSTVDNPLTWTFCNWGEDLVACPRGGKIYILDTSAWEGASTTNLALISSNAPASAYGVFMNDANRTLVALGGVDPLAVAWCDQEDYTTWTAAPNNTAGATRCENGSIIIGRMECRGGHLISTNTAIYSFRYVGLPYVFSLDILTTGPSMISPHCGIVQDNVTYWMGPDAFYRYDGTVLPLPCEVHAYVFGRLNRIQSFKVFAGTCRKFNEVIWFYCAEGSNEVDSCVGYNTQENTWWIGDVARTSWIDASVVLQYPIAADPSGNIYAHEFGTTDDGAGIDYRLETGPIEIPGGQTFLHARKMALDFDRISGSTHQVTIEVYDWPMRAARTKGPYSITSLTEQLSVRARGRQQRFLWEGSDDIRWGIPRVKLTAHGEKP